MNERFDSFQIKVYEALRNSIFEAIYGSQNVRSLIKIIQDHQMLDDLYAYMDSVEIRHLIESLAFESVEKKSLPEKAENSDTVSEETVQPDLSDSQYIDGRKLTQNEKMFESFFQAVFNEEDWLKRVKVRL